MTAPKIDYLQTFLNLTREDFRNVVLNNETIKLIRKSIEQWLKLKENLDKRLLTRYKQLSREIDLSRISKGKNIDLSAGGLTKTFEYYSSQKRRVRSLTDIEDITKLFKDGYELIHRIREVFTRQEITYSILYTPSSGDVSGETVMEVKLNLNQILSSVSMATSDIKTVKAGVELTNATNLLLTNAAVKRTLELMTKQEANLQKVRSNLDKPLLWNSLLKFRDSQTQKYSGNLGQLYEVYSVFRKDKRYQNINFIGNSKGEANTIGLAGKLLSEAIGNNDPGWQIGDIGTEQLKSVANGAASLMSTSTIQEILKDVNKALSKNTREDMEKALKEIYTVNRDSFNNEIDKKAQDEAIASIEETIKLLFDNN